MDHSSCARVGEFTRMDVHHTHEGQAGWWVFPSEVLPVLTSVQLAFLRTYEDGPFIWDAATIRSRVLELDELGLIKPSPPECKAHELTAAGRAVLEMHAHRE